MRGVDAFLDRRNRSTAWRIVGAVLTFHGLALFSAYLLLDRAQHPDMPGPIATTRTDGAPVAVSVPAVVPATREPGPQWPAWLSDAQSHDTAAPWRVDANGHVHFDHPEIIR